MRLTLTEIICGFLLGTSLGALAAITMILSPLLKRWLLPVLVISQAIPVFALAPILVLWFGYGMASKIAMAVLIIFFPVASSFYYGMQRTDPDLLELARVMDATPYTLLRYIIIPSALPAFASGVRVAIADLKGKTVGYSVGGFETVLLKVMLEKEGLTLDDVKLVNVNFSLSPSLFTGQADAVIGAFRNFELNQMDIEKRPGRPFFVEEYGIPAYDELILVANQKTLGDKKLRRFVDGLEAGVQYLVNHPEESWKLFTRGQRKDLDDELNRRAWRDTLPRFALRPGALDRNRYLRFAQFLQEQETVTNVPPLESWAVELK